MSLDSVQLSGEPGPSAPRVAPRRIRRLGSASFLIAVLGVALEVIAIVIGSGGGWVAATVLAWVVIGLFALAFALGLLAILTRNGRRFGLAAAILGLVANPLTLVGVFGLLGAN
ncbi:hypothetical protein ACVXZ4_02310 [Lacisediminihabitans sp. FW035]